MLRAPMLALALAVLATPAAAQCFADYKASRAPPLQLHYGVMEVPRAACGDRGAIAAELARRLAPQGWRLLRVVSVFGPEGLAQRQGDAGPFFLRF